MIQRLLFRTVLAVGLSIAPVLHAAGPAAPATGQTIAAASPVPVAHAATPSSLPKQGPALGVSAAPSVAISAGLPASIAVHPGASVQVPSSYERTRIAMREGAVVNQTWLGDKQVGMHPARIVTFAHQGTTVRAIVKGELPEAGYGLTYMREAAASHLAESLGHGLEAIVPPTTRRVVDGQPSSVQEIAEGAKSFYELEQSGKPLPSLNLALMEKLRVFDYVIGNKDRHGKNLLVRWDEHGQAVPVAIDNGLSLPEGAVPDEHFAWPTLLAPHSGALSAETKAFIRGIDSKGVAQVLKQSGISREATLHTLRRVERVKKDSTFLELQPADINAQGEFMSAELKGPAVLGKHTFQQLSKEELEKVDGIVSDVYGKLN
jgi:hypothetical protein